jgi:plastocyanin
MIRGRTFALVLALVCAQGSAIAATVNIAVTDDDGKPAASAIVSLMPQTGSVPAPTNIPAEAIIAQRHQMFVPLVVIIRRGGHVVFTNEDQTMHQVYSFSPIKQFEYEIHQGRKSPAVEFDKAGVAAIGCNIHDNMVAFVYVAQSPWTATTDAHGHVKFDNVPDGAYRANVWHPKLVPGRAPPSQAVRVAGAETNAALSIPLLGGPMPGMSHSHAQDY